MSSVTAYQWSDKIKAVQLFMLNGNMRTVSEALGIPYTVLSDWKRSAWWPQAVEELRQARKAKLGTTLGHIIDTSLEVIQDRLENGDFVLNNKTGVMERRKVSLRDAAQVTNNLLTRQIQMEELADKLEHNKDTVQETLKLLANEFQKMTRKISTSEVVDIQFKEKSDAVDDKRETRLQKGSSEVYEQAGSEEEEGGAECS